MARRGARTGGGPRGRREGRPATGRATARRRAAAAPAPAGSAGLHVAAGVAPWAGRALGRDLERVAALAAREARKPVHLDVAVLGDRAMDRLHRDHLDQPGTTDVLSWVLEDDAGGLVGALALGASVARRQARAHGHPPYHEALLYAVHGTLHLLGYDDHAPGPRARMRRAERRWLAQLGLGDVVAGGARASTRSRRP